MQDYKEAAKVILNELLDDVTGATAGKIRDAGEKEEGDTSSDLQGPVEDLQGPGQELQGLVEEAGGPSYHRTWPAASPPAFRA